MTAASPGPDVNAHIAKRIRQRRLALGLRQADVAQALGVSFQHVHRMECASTQITVKRLWEVSQALNTPVITFFEGLPPKGS